MALEVLFTNFSVELWILSVTLIVFYLIQKLRHNKKYPPGPLGLPVIGYVPFLTAEPHRKFHELKKKYGNVFSLRLGGKLAVVLNDVNSVREYLNKQDFHGRPPMSTLNPKNFETSIHSVNFKMWFDNRKFLFHTVRGFGKGKFYIEELIQDELGHFLGAVESEVTKKQPVDINELICSSVSNVISVILFGKRFEYGDETRQFLNHCIKIITEYADQTSPLSFMRWIEVFPVLNRIMRANHYRPLFDKLRSIIDEVIEDHRKTLDPENPRDYVDAYLAQMKILEENNQEMTFTEEMLVGTAYSTFGAGGEPVRASIVYALAEILSHPEAKKRIEKEIDEVIGHGRLPLHQDIKHMPYTQAALMETERLHTIIPVNLLRYTTEHTRIGDFEIPKDTTVLSNLWAVHRDPNYWEKPEEFMPERFLDAEGELEFRPESYMPFSVGKRVCPGEPLAMDELFIFVTTLLQKYDTTLAKGVNAMSEGFYMDNKQPKLHPVYLAPRE